MVIVQFKGCTLKSENRIITLSDDKTSVINDSEKELN